MKYLHTHATLLLAAMIGGLIALGPTGSQGRAAADLGHGRQSTYWCMEHLGAIDDGTRQADDSADTAEFAEDRLANSFTDTDSYDTETYDGYYNDSFSGQEGEPATYAADTSRGDVSTDDEYTADRDDTAYGADRYDDEYADYGRYKGDTDADFEPETMPSESTAYDADRYHAEYSYQESIVEEKYGYAEEMSGRTSDQESADTAEQADEQSNAEMEDADQFPTSAELYMDPDEIRDEASEQGPATESAWDGGPNEADLEDGKWMPSENNDPIQNEAKATGLEQFGFLPGQLLIQPDRELLGDLRQMADLSPGERQVAFRDYVESLGSEAIEFATQYESATGDEAAMLSDDIASSAAFLAVFRLYEQGELGIDEAIDLLRQTLDNLSQEWIEGVNELTPESEFSYRYPVTLEGMTSPASVSAPRALWEALSSWAAGRAGQWKTALLGICTMQLCNLDWHAMLNSALTNLNTYPMD